jgi:hypothetical protein
MADAYNEVLGYPQDIDDQKIRQAYRPDRVQIVTNKAGIWVSPEDEAALEEHKPRPEDAK